MNDYLQTTGLKLNTFMLYESYKSRNKLAIMRLLNGADIDTLSTSELGTLTEHDLITHINEITPRGWSRISTYCCLSEIFIRANIHRLDVKKIGWYQKLSTGFISDCINANRSKDHTIRKFASMQAASPVVFERVTQKDRTKTALGEPSETVSNCTQKISKPAKLALELKKTSHGVMPRLDVYDICQRQQLTEEFIEMYQNWVVWDVISYYQTLSKSFITRFRDRVSWPAICERQQLSEPFIIKHIDRVCWHTISRYQRLSEPFMTIYMEYIDWSQACLYQEITLKFAVKNSAEMDWQALQQVGLITHDDAKSYMMFSRITRSNPINIPKRAASR